MSATAGLRNGIPAHILVHTATPLEYDEPASPEWIEGEPGDEGGGEPTPGVPFACVLFLPGPGGEQANPYRARVVKTPTLLYNPLRLDSSLIVLDRDSEVMIDAPELAAWAGGSNPARWQLVGVAQPFGPPGQVIGIQAALRQVQD